MKTVPLSSQNTVECTASLPFPQYNLFFQHSRYVGHPFPNDGVSFMKKGNMVWNSALSTAYI
jgi:hypothetical protein